MVTCLGVLFLGKWYLSRTLKHYEERLTAEAGKLVAGEPCQSASVLIEIGKVIGSEAGRSAKASLMADMSHVQRAANSAAVDGAIEGVSAANPAIGGVLQSMGRGKASKLLNNPLVQLAIQGFMSGKGGGGGGNHAASGGGKPPGSFSL